MKLKVSETNEGANAAWGYADGNWACRVDITSATHGQSFNPVEESNPIQAYSKVMLIKISNFTILFPFISKLAFIV